MDNQKDSPANPNQMSPISGPDKKSNTLKLALILLVVVAVATLVWSLASGGDDAPVTTDQPEGQSQTVQPAAPANGEEAAGPGDSANSDGSQGQNSTDTSQSGDGTDHNAPDANQDPGSDAGEQTDPSLAPVGGSYVDYEDQAQLDQLADTDRWLNFHAPWCPYCVHLDDDITANSDEIPVGVTIVRIDYDSNQDLRVHYGVNRQTTIVRVDADGNEIDRFVGYGQFANLDNLATAFGY